MKFEITVIDNLANEQTHVIDASDPLRALELTHLIYQHEKELKHTQYKILSMHRIYRGVDGSYCRMAYDIPKSTNPARDDLTFSRIGKS